MSKSNHKYAVLVPYTPSSTPLTAFPDFYGSPDAAREAYNLARVSPRICVYNVRQVNTRADYAKARATFNFLRSGHIPCFFADLTKNEIRTTCYKTSSPKPKVK